MKRTFALFLILALMVTMTSLADDKKKDDEKPAINAGTFSALKWRNIGPALMSGRVSDIAIDPRDQNTWFVAVASGGVWKTNNAGTTWNPIFDNYGSYSIGCVTIDPNNSDVIWVGTGENNSQRSVGYGDGVYKSIDGGRSFENVGLKTSEHIGNIIVDPRDSNVVFVASQGPLWKDGGERGIFKTVDGGKTWKNVLEVSPMTGANEVHFETCNPDVLYASTYQRRRHVWTLIDGGPETDIYKSVDAGETWFKINKGLPGVDKGKIGLAVSPQKPGVVYAVIEAAKDQSGFYRTDNGGASWNRISDYCGGSPQYYNEIFCDPNVYGRIYAMDTMLQVSHDDGKTFEYAGESKKHVDNHAIAFNKKNPEWYLVGCDGGLYETNDRGKNYKYFSNLPITQFYKVAVDYAEPFYNIYGGTQDNNTLGGPSRTTKFYGSENSDWNITVGGDGFGPAVDPTDPNIVYSQWQNGGLVRYDKVSGENLDIRPQPEKGEKVADRWNWDAPILISPHSHTRLYYGSQRLYVSNDRGDSWTRISDDLTRALDRNKMKVMGKVWGVDTVAKNMSTSIYGNLVSVSESPVKEGLIYTGSDDGLISVTEDGGKTWRKIEKIEGVPELAYVSDIEASLYDENVVFATFYHYKSGDFKPYVMRSADKGTTWTSIASDLPERGSVYTIAQDHKVKDLLFVGTEYSVFCSINGGKNWFKFASGLPVVSIHDIVIQKRENDLVLATFGRGFYVLDDYTPLREASEKMLAEEAKIFPVKKALLFQEVGRNYGNRGAMFYTAPNPEYGTVVTYYLKESLKTLKGERSKKEAELLKEKKDVYYPSWDELKAEDREETPRVFMIFKDEAGNVVNRISVPSSEGVHRVTWDMRYPGSSPVNGNSRYSRPGPEIAPGKYSVSLAKYVEGVFTELAVSQTFEVEPLNLHALAPQDRAEVLAYYKKLGELQRTVGGATAVAREAADRIKAIRKTIETLPGADEALMKEAKDLEVRYTDLMEEYSGDPTREARQESGDVSLSDRIRNASGGSGSTYGPTKTHRRSYEIAVEEFGLWLPKLRTLVEVDLVKLEEKLEALGAPYTPGRKIPTWNK